MTSNDLQKAYDTLLPKLHKHSLMKMAIASDLSDTGIGAIRTGEVKNPSIHTIIKLMRGIEILEGGDANK